MPQGDHDAAYRSTRTRRDVARVNAAYMTRRALFTACPFARDRDRTARRRCSRGPRAVGLGAVLRGPAELDAAPVERPGRHGAGRRPVRDDVEAGDGDASPRRWTGSGADRQYMRTPDGQYWVAGSTSSCRSRSAAPCARARRASRAAYTSKSSAPGTASGLVQLSIATGLASPAGEGVRYVRRRMLDVEIARSSPRERHAVLGLDARRQDDREGRGERERRPRHDDDAPARRS